MKKNDVKKNSLYIALRTAHDRLVVAFLILKRVENVLFEKSGF